jgi:hypothetical protein
VGGWVELSSSAAGTSLILSVPLGDAVPDARSAGDNHDAEASAWSSR